MTCSELFYSGRARRQTCICFLGPNRAGKGLFRILEHGPVQPAEENLDERRLERTPVWHGATRQSRKDRKEPDERKGERGLQQQQEMECSRDDNKIYGKWWRYAVTACRVRLLLRQAVTM